MTHNRRIRLEVTRPDADPHIPSLVSIYPTNDWHERETWDMFGIIFDGHPALTRILMPDDWPGHPQRKDYPLGGIPVEYKGGTHPAARRAEVVHTDARSNGTDQDMLRRHRARPAQGKVFTVTGQDWDSITEGLGDTADERVVVNMGPQHPSTHGVLRLILELEGETVTEARCGIGYLHTGIEKNMEYRSWVQGVDVLHPDGLPLARSSTRRPTPSASSGCSTSRTTSRRRRRSCASSSWSSTASPPTWSASRPAAWRSAR